MRVRSQVRATIRIGIGVAAGREQHGRERGIRGDHGNRPYTAGRK